MVDSSRTCELNAWAILADHSADTPAIRPSCLSRVGIGDSGPSGAGVPADEPKDLDVLRRVHFHQPDQKLPQRGVLDVAELLRELLQRSSVGLLLGEEQFGDLDNVPRIV